MRRYFAAEKQVDKQIGAIFSSEWKVLVFSTKKARNDFIKNATNPSTKKILFSEATKYATTWSVEKNRAMAPKAYTTEYWGIVNKGDKDIEGYLGTLMVCDWRSPKFMRLY